MKKSAFILSVLLASIFLSMEGYSQDVVDPSYLKQ